MEGQASKLDGLLPKSLFTFLKNVFDQSKACSRRFKNLPAGFKHFKVLIFNFAKIVAQLRFNDRSSEFGQ